MKSLIFIVLVVVFQTAIAQQVKNLAPTPPMGWNSWNWFGKKGINEEIAKQCIDAIVDQGLLDAGYKYFVIDGGWRDTKLGPNGELLPHPVKFPHGIKVLADYAHSKGLKFGLHTVPGTADCGGDPVGGFGHEEIQVKQFVDWGLDFIKLDKCRYADGWNETLLKETYEKWHNLLKNCGRDIVLSISAYTWRDWYPEVGQMARTTGDIRAKVNGGAVFDSARLSVCAVALENNESAQYAGNGYWNDPDMMVTGNQGLTLEEQKAHFALWCIMSSPLILGNDPRNMSPEEKEIILNKVAISVNQDPTEQGKLIKTEKGNTEIWAKNLKGGAKAVLLLNRNDKESQNINITATDIGIKGQATIQDIYTGDDLGVFVDSFCSDVAPHSGLFLLINPKKL